MTTMNNTTKRLFSFTLMSMFVLLFALNFAFAEQAAVGANAQGVAAITDPAKAALSDSLTYLNKSSWIAGLGLGETLSKILFTLLIFMIVYSIFSRIPLFDERSWIRFPFSAIVAILSMAYVTPKEVIVLMQAYSGMGFVIAGAIP